jgi:PEP-CTERM/exosortase A-associated glycosyltransferase
MRILHILDHSLPLQSGYVFRSMGILHEQRARGWETLQLTTPKHYANSAPRETIGEWEFHRTPRPNGLASKLPVLDQLSVITATAARLRELVQDFRPEILHAHSPVLNAMAAFEVAADLGLPVVYEVRSFWEDAALEHGTATAKGPRYHITRYLETRALRRADAITAISEGLRSDILGRNIPAEKVTLVPNAVSTDQFSPSRAVDEGLAARLGVAGMNVLGFAGSFYSYEGLDLLLEALPKVLAAKPETKVLLIGGGSEEARLKADSERLGLGGNVVFTGRVPHDEVQDYYQLIDVMVYPRKSGRLTELVTPLKPLEAMAQERIVLASDVGGHKELIEDGKTGYLFKAGDAEDLAQRLLNILDHREDWSRIRASGRAFIERERTWQSVVARYQDVYSSVLGKYS